MGSRSTSRRQPASKELLTRSVNQEHVNTPHLGNLFSFSRVPPHINKAKSTDDRNHERHFPRRKMLRRFAVRHCRHRSVEIQKAIDTINHDVLRPNDAFGLVSRSTYSTPMAMLLGNHSAGKSTFINKLLGCEVQDTGVAPTDDGFTVIMRGQVDLDADGPSAVSTQEYQFEDLQQYGANFVNHFRLKVRKLPQDALFPAGMMIVDTPGMIDTPIQHDIRTSEEGQNRGYDFLAACRWFAQRADVILLLFDPANPGTTGETLDVLTKSLSGFEHKFLILMNKVDVFEKVTDFARAYGTVCWNLSKVIRMKDIPRIYTTYTPLLTADGKPRPMGGAVPASELERARRDVLEEVLKAPLRRFDNLLTEMDEAARRLLLSGKVATALRRRMRKRQVLVYGGIAGTCVLLPVGIGATLFPILGPSIIPLFVLSGLLAVVANMVAKKHLTEHARLLEQTIDTTLDELFPLKTKTTELLQRWDRVCRPAVLESICVSRGIDNLPVLSSKVAKRLEHVVQVEVPELRTLVTTYKEEVQKDSIKK